MIAGVMDHTSNHTAAPLTRISIYDVLNLVLPGIIAIFQTTYLLRADLSSRNAGAASSGNAAFTVLSPLRNRMRRRALRGAPGRGQLVDHCVEAQIRFRPLFHFYLAVLVERLRQPTALRRVNRNKAVNSGGQC